jgi:mycofactocin precursor
MTDRTTKDEDVAEHDEEPVTELLVEEVSIDGLCGVY